MTKLEQLIRHFERFPGIGARQARRFAHHILREKKAVVTELADLIGSIQSSVTECQSCYRYFVPSGNSDLCAICSDSSRDTSRLIIVESDSDMQSIEKSGAYSGLYFILGGSAPLLDSKDTVKLRGGALKHIVEERLDDLKEIVLAFSVNPDGENTARYVQSLISELIQEKKITVSTLGRGLSTGSELEYADPETIKNALRNRG